MQPPCAIALYQVGGIDRIADILRRIILDTKADGLSPADQRDAHGAAFPIHTIGMQVVARRAGVRVWLADLALDLVSLILPTQIEGTLERLRRLDTCLHM